LKTLSFVFSRPFSRFSFFSFEKNENLAITLYQKVSF
jgi:hypothetical protein